MRYADKLKKMTPRELIFEVLGSKAADYQVVNELMNRVLPDWEKQFTDEELEAPNTTLERYAPNNAFTGIPPTDA